MSKKKYNIEAEVWDLDRDFTKELYVWAEDETDAEQKAKDKLEEWYPNSSYEITTIEED